ncbi:hypothetical protein [Streptomyces sp. NPDC047061]|uniref:hypothetical protein n=1 Tax=Streptomyces sp. NPDC047061 TaxID=3154605 RepID=UPI0033F68E8E
MSTRFGADLITFYDPAFWQVADGRELAATAAERPEWFWTKVLDSAVAAGLSTLETRRTSSTPRTSARCSSTPRRASSSTWAA